jgi:hypothetical protein
MTQRDKTQQLIEAVGGGDRDGNPPDPDLLELYRAAWHELPYGTPEQQAALRTFHEAADAYWSAHPPAQDGDRVGDGRSWVAGVERAMSGDPGVDPADDDW